MHVRDHHSATNYGAIVHTHNADLLPPGDDACRRQPGFLARLPIMRPSRMLKIRERFPQSLGKGLALRQKRPIRFWALPGVWGVHPFVLVPTSRAETAEDMSVSFGRAGWNVLECKHCNKLKPHNELQ